MRRASILLAATLGCAPRPPTVGPAPQPTASGSADAAAATAPILGDPTAQHLPTGADLTPLAAPGSQLLELDPRFPGHPELRAGYATSVALSPDGRTLAILTSGYNRFWADDGAPITGALDEHVFLFDVHDPEHVSQTQVLAVPNAFWGLAFSPDGNRIFTSGGPDDAVWEIDRSSEAAAWNEPVRIRLGHAMGLGRRQGALAAGLALTSDGGVLVVANHANDSVSIIDVAARAAVAEIDLRPGGGKPGGEFPAAVAIVGKLAYVSAQRDREIVEVDLATRKVTRRVSVGGQPTKLAVSPDGARIYVADANTDDVSVIDRASLKVAATIPVGGPAGSLAASLRGANPNALALSPDGRSLYVTLGGANAVAVVALDEHGGTLSGMVPTGFYPNDVAVAKDGAHVFVAYGKSVSGPNPKGPWSDGVRVRQKPYMESGGNQFVLQRMRGGLHAFPIPSRESLAALTARSIANEHLDREPAVPPIIARLRGKIRHVVYVVAENRTFDQLLADVPSLDGDRRLLLWGEGITPNQHALTRTFSGYDRFFDSGGVSGDGWQWSTAARTTDVAEKEIPLMYAERGKHSYDWEGKNRGVNVSLPTPAARRAEDPRVPDDDDLLPGQADVAAPDRPREGGTGYLWDAAKAAKLRVRNYGFFIDDGRYGLPKSDKAGIPPIREPYKTKAVVAHPTALGLADDTDPYFRGFDMGFPDYWRARELVRELDEYVKAKSLPELMLVRLGGDHLGAFGRAVDGVDTPDTQVADHDYALGMVVEALSKTPFWEDTIVLALEDDAQNGADHVDAHRSVLFFAGAYAARGAVVHTTYTTPSALRTIELLLGMAPLGRTDAVAPPIVEAFSETADLTPFVAQVPAVLRSTKLPLPAATPAEHPAAARGTAASWAKATAGMSFDHEDELPTAFNQILYCGLAPALCR